VSETSVRAAVGWSSGAMVARYTSALSGELAVREFQDLGIWGSLPNRLTQGGANDLGEWA